MSFLKNVDETTQNRKSSFFANKMGVPNKLVDTNGQKSIIEKYVDVRYPASQISKRVAYTGVETYGDIISSVLPDITDQHQVSTSLEVGNKNYGDVKNQTIGSINLAYITITQGKLTSGNV